MNIGNRMTGYSKGLAAGIAAIALSTAAVALTTESASAYYEPHAKYMPSKDIVATAASTGSFETLLAAAEAAGLVETLSEGGPFTVFAPTDEAFAAIPKETLNGLLKDKAALSKILTYHVVPGKVMSHDARLLTKARTVQGQSITIASTDGLTVDGAKVIKGDILATNGVIHVIDRVIMPK